MAAGEGNSKLVTVISIAVCVALLLVVILVPSSLGYVEYYEYGLDQNKISRTVDTEQVYNPGRYLIGPAHGFLKYRRDAHFEKLDSLAVFSRSASEDSIGLEFKVDVAFTYLLLEDEIGELHRELASKYAGTIVSRAKDAIKNEAVSVSFNEYFRDRIAVERRFRTAVEERWREPPSLHCSLDQFHLGRIQIPESVATKQLEAQIQNEKNGMESFTQQAQLEREQTAVEVNVVDLETELVLKTATAEAKLLVERARSEADRIKALARIDGLATLLESAGISDEDHLSAVSYIRTLAHRTDNVSLRMSYLPPDSVLKTAMA